MTFFAARVRARKLNVVSAMVKNLTVAFGCQPIGKILAGAADGKAEVFSKTNWKVEPAIFWHVQKDNHKFARLSLAVAVAK